MNKQNRKFKNLDNSEIDKKLAITKKKEQFTNDNKENLYYVNVYNWIVGSSKYLDYPEVILLLPAMYSSKCVGLGKKL